MKKKKPTLLQIIMHIGSLYPLARLIFNYYTNNLSPNPIQDFERRTGFAAITLLIFSLESSPISALFGWREILKRRRTLGLYAFLYATLHVIVFLALDYGFAWGLIVQAILEKRYTLIGSLSFLLLLPLAITSFRYWMVKLGKNWKRLHKLVYLIAPLVVIHFAWARKGNIFSLQGDVLLPFSYGVTVILLLTLRIPAIKKGIASLRT
ncbi:MAG: sulfoxide reductase heme-binding subunit YedZ [Anaerolineales bacterium]|nr:sulfoxide reductase heme-binding subunit YedZ [Anaerolineales bacterium]